MFTMKSEDNFCWHLISLVSNVFWVSFLKIYRSMILTHTGFWFSFSIPMYASLVRPLPNFCSKENLYLPSYFMFPFKGILVLQTPKLRSLLFETDWDYKFSDFSNMGSIITEWYNIMLLNGQISKKQLLLF